MHHMTTLTILFILTIHGTTQLDNPTAVLLKFHDQTGIPMCAWVRPQICLCNKFRKLLLLLIHMMADKLHLPSPTQKFIGNLFSSWEPQNIIGWQRTLEVPWTRLLYVCFDESVYIITSTLNHLSITFVMDCTSMLMSPEKLFAVSSCLPGPAWRKHSFL